VIAGLDALDWGLIEAGVMAAEALARVRQLEAQLADHRKALALALQYADQPAPPPPRARHLSAVPPIGGAS
jgi:hypothetical protein